MKKRISKLLPIFLFIFNIMNIIVVFFNWYKTDFITNLLNLITPFIVFIFSIPYLAKINPYTSEESQIKIRNYLLSIAPYLLAVININFIFKAVYNWKESEDINKYLVLFFNLFLLVNFNKIKTLFKKISQEQKNNHCKK